MIENIDPKRHELICKEIGLVIGSSAAMTKLIEDICQLSQSDLPVLITGPTGSGKELVATLLHQLSSPSDSPFLDVNCGAIPEALIESQLFGHMKGAFTGATMNKEGFFTLAATGSLFLDEIGELPLWQQTKLLRVLETNQYRPVGGSVNLHFRGRIITATHANLKEMVGEKRFREDLFYRLNTLTLHVPSLNERSEDIPLLIKHFMKRHSKKIGFSDQAMKRLENAHWSGNVRELKNAIDKIVIMSKSQEIDVDELKNYITIVDNDHSYQLNHLAEQLLKLNVPNKLIAIENAMVQLALKNCKGNKSSAARALGVHRKYIERKLNQLNDSTQSIKDLYQLAAEKMQCCDYKGALNDLQKLLSYIDNAMITQENETLELEALIMMGSCLRTFNGWNHPDVISIYEKSVYLANKLNNLDKLHSVHFGLWVNQLLVLDLDDALLTMFSYKREAEHLNNVASIAHATIFLANTYFWMGEHQKMVYHLQLFLELYQHEQQIVIDLGQDPFIYYLMFKALHNVHIGKIEQSKEMFTKLLNYAHELDHPFCLATSLQAGAWISYIIKEYDDSYQYAEQLLVLAKKYDFIFFEGMAEIFIGHKLAYQNNYNKGQDMINTAYRKKINAGTDSGKLFNSMYGIIFSDISLFSGDYKTGLDVLEKTITVSIEHKEYCYFPDALLMQARLNLALNNLDDAESLLKEAITKAQKSGSKICEYNSSCELASLYMKNSKMLEVKKILMPMMLRFSEQSTELDLTWANDLLDTV